MRKLTKNISTDNKIYPRVDKTDDKVSIFTFPSSYTINQNLTDPTKIVTGSIGENNSVLKFIRKNSHRYLAKKNWGRNSNNMSIK